MRPAQARIRCAARFAQGIRGHEDEWPKTRSTDRRSEDTCTVAQGRREYGSGCRLVGQLVLRRECYRVGNGRGRKRACAARRAPIAGAVMTDSALLCQPFRAVAILLVVRRDHALLRARRVLGLRDRHRTGGPLRHARFEAQGHNQKATHEERERVHGGLQGASGLSIPPNSTAGNRVSTAIWHGATEPESASCPSM